MKRVLFIVLLVFLAACTTSVDTQEDDVTSLVEEVEDETMGKTYVTVETNKGNFKIRLYDETPLSRDNFVQLVESGFYDGLVFHRYEPGFVIQGGDPNGDGTGGSEKNVDLEVVGLSHSKGTIGMARANEPNSGSSQWFVNLADNNFLDPNYTVFGEIVEGLDVAESLRIGDKMTKVAVEKS
jgi:cyclophilin family peptidyl-prolyl cis-trans isomerase